jgi:peptidyl-dipeptidase Dcp
MVGKISNIFLIILIFCYSCSSKKQTMTINPLIEDYKTPYNSVPFNKINPGHFKPAFDTIIDQTRKKIEQITNSEEKPDFNNTIVALERANNKLNRLYLIIENLNHAETNKELQSAIKEITPLYTDFSNDILLNSTLFSKIKMVFNETDPSTLDIEDSRLLEKTYKDFERNGANLSESDKLKYREITRELAQLSVEFRENVLAETNNYFLHIQNHADLSGLPENVIAAAAEEARNRKLEGWIFTLQIPSYLPFMKYSNNRELRKQLFIAYNQRGLSNNEHNNENILKRIIELRISKSQLLGYNTFADLVLCERMAESTDKVETFLNDLLIASLPAGKREYQEIQDLAKELGADFVVEAWDWGYYSEKLKKQKFDIDDEMTRPYFQLENVEKGVLGLASTLFGLSFKENSLIPLYHKDVKAIEVYNDEGNFIALLYLDYFPRSGKSGGAWMTEFQQQHVSSTGEEQRPHVSLVFNFTKPTEKRPSLLTYNEVTTLLHEFGHGLHSILSKCKYEELSGTSVYQDFVELPSQLLENWADQKEWLDKVSVHFETGEKIPEEMVQKIISSKNFLSGYMSLRQLSFGMLDIKWHTLTEVYKGDIIEFEENAMAPARVLPKVSGTCMSPSFNHIFGGGYAAGYYSYKWAEVLDADAFAYFKEKGIYNKEVALSFKENILSRGGSEHPMELYMRFRGKKPTIDALLDRSGLK